MIRAYRIDHVQVMLTVAMNSSFFFSFLKGALIGSHKGSCRMYNTSGM